MRKILMVGGVVLALSGCEKFSDDANQQAFVTGNAVAVATINGCPLMVKQVKYKDGTEDRVYFLVKNNDGCKNVVGLSASETYQSGKTSRIETVAMITLGDE
jgi:hypothetical protein